MLNKKRDKKVVNDVRNYMNDLNDFIVKNNLGSGYSEDLKKIMGNLDSELKVVVIGEVNSGKSSFINSLLGEEICSIDSDPCTDTIGEVSYGQNKSEKINNNHIKQITMNNELLKAMTIVDTPGVNSPIKKHSDITKDYIFNADLIFVVFSAKNPFGQAAWELLAQAKGDLSKKVVFIMQQIDLVKPQDLKDNMEYIINFARKKEFLSPMMFPVSSKYQTEGKEESGFNKVRSYINDVILQANTMDDKISGRISVVDDMVKNITNVMNNEKNHSDQLEKSREIRNNIMKDAIIRNKETNRLALNTYSEDYMNMLNELERGVLDATNATVMFKNLKMKYSFATLFGTVINQDKKRRDDLVKEFDAEIIDNMSRLRDEVKRNLSDSSNDQLNLSQKEVYKLIDERYDVVALAVLSKSLASKRESSFIQAIFDKYHKKLTKSLSVAKRIIGLICVIIIIVLPVAFTLSIMNAIKAAVAGKSLSEVGDLLNEGQRIYKLIPKPLTNFVFKGIKNILTRILANPPVLVGVIGIKMGVDFLFYLATKFIVELFLKKKIGKLSSKAYSDYKSKEGDLVTDFNQELKIELEEIETLLLDQLEGAFRQLDEKAAGTEEEKSTMMKELEGLALVRQEIEKKLTC
ncbi:MAG TPA: hypothetical protein GX707_19535 [Epulopiscium sp.]|nr:hypothetical protein [Candidatus Epulonipiscium sp.]